MNAISAARTGSMARKGYVPGPGLERLEYLAGGIEGDELNRHAETPAELAREVDGDAARLAVGRVLCARTMLPKLIAARSVPAGAMSFTTSAGRCSTMSLRLLGRRCCCSERGPLQPRR